MCGDVTWHRAVAGPPKKGAPLRGPAPAAVASRTAPTDERRRSQPEVAAVAHSTEHLMLELSDLESQVRWLKCVTAHGLSLRKPSQTG